MQRKTLFAHLKQEWAFESSDISTFPAPQRLRDGALSELTSTA